MESLHLWRGINERINGDTGFRQPGIMCLCETDAEVARQEAWLDQARQYQVDAHLLRGGELDGVIPVPAPLSSPACTHQPTDARNLRKRHPPSPRQHVRTGPLS